MKGLRFFRSDREGTIPILIKYMKVDQAAGEKIYDGSVDSFIDTGMISEEFQRKVLEFEFDKADQAMLQKAFDFSLLRELK